jgi:hypothetical protein
MTTEFAPTTTAPIRSPTRPATGVEWPTYGFDNARMRDVAVDLVPPFQQRWVFLGRALLEFPPAVAYGLVYLPTFDGRFYALAAGTGRVRWMRRSGRCGWASPAVAKRIVYMTFIGSSECQSRRVALPTRQIPSAVCRTDNSQSHGDPVEGRRKAAARRISTARRGTQRRRCRSARFGASTV